MKVEEEQAVVVPLSPSRLPLWPTAVFLFCVFGLSFFIWWNYYPITWELFAEYWQRDLKYLKPDWAGFARVWSFNAGAMSLLVLVQIAFLGLGRRALDWIFGARIRGIWGYLLALGLGKGLLGVLVLGLGLSGILSKLLFYVILAAACSFAGYAPLRQAAAGWRGAWPAFLASKAAGLALLRSLSAVEWSLLFVIFAVLAGNYFPALQPEWFYDSLVYHMAVPEQYLLEHKIFNIGHTFFPNFPFLQEMQYMFLLGLGNGVAGKVLHWTDGLLSALAVYALARLFLGRAGALLAQAIFLSQPTLRFLQHVTMVELGLTYFEILAVAAFMRALGWIEGAGGEGRKDSWKRWMFLCAWLLGFAQGTKYLAIFCSAILLFLFLAMPRTWMPVFRRASRITGVLVVVGWASVWTLPWLGKNWLFVGNPVFPMANGIFSTLNWDDGLYRNWMYDNRKYGTGSSEAGVWQWLAMPLLASIDSPHFGTFTLNLFPLLFLPLMFLYRGPPTALRFLALYAGAYSILWAVTSQQTRFLFPMAAQASVPIAFVIIRLAGGFWPLRSVLYGAAAWILLVCTWGQIHNRYTNRVLLPFLSGNLDHAGILKFGVVYHESIQRANDSVPPGSRLLFLGGDESYYAKCRRICSSIYDRPAAGNLARKARSADDLRRLLKRSRVTHLLIHRPRAEEYAPRGMFEWESEARDRFLKVLWDYGRLICLNNDVFVFELGEKKIPEGERKRGVPAYFHPIATVKHAHELTSLADDYFKREKFKEALQVCEELIRLLPDVSYVYSYRAYARTFLKQDKGAIADYEQAIALDYPPPMVYYNLGLLLREEDKFERALDAQLYAVQTAPSLEQAREQAFELAIKTGRYSLALELGEGALALGLPASEWLKKVNQLRVMARHFP